MSHIAALRVQAATDIILASPTLSSDVEAQLALGRLLVATRPSEADTLTHARALVSRIPDNADAHNDFGVCLLERGSLEQALDEFNVALRLKPRMREAVFNRALCYKALLLVSAEKAELTHLSTLEREPGWLDECKSRLEEVRAMSELLTSAWDRDQPIEEFSMAFAARDLARARRLAEENLEFIRPYALFDLTVNYLKVASSGDLARAEARLSKLEFLADAYAESKGDLAVRDRANHLRQLGRSGSAVELEMMKRFRRAAELLRATGAGSAAKHGDELRILEALLKQSRGQSNDLLTISIYDVLQRYHYGIEQYTQSIAIIQKALKLIEGRGWVRDRAMWLNSLGLANLRLGKDSVAMDHFKSAMGISRTMRERPLEAKILQFQGVAYWHLGDLDSALARFRESTALLFQVSPVARELAYNYLNVADIYTIRLQHSLAVEYAEEASRFAETAREHGRMAQALSLAGVAYARMANLEQAKARIGEALVKAGDGSNPVSVLTRRLVLTRAGEIALRSGQLSDALKYYTEAEELSVVAQGDALQRIAALSGRAETHAMAGSSEEAKLDLQEALGVIERYRGRIRESDYRSSFLDATQSVFDQLITLQATDREDRSEAFATSEEGRARTLLDRLTPDEAPLRLREVRREVSEDMVLLVYSVTPKGIFIFAVTDSGLDVRQSRMNIEETQSAVYGFLSLIRNHAPIDEIKQKSVELYERLINPVSDLLQGKRRVCIVPDKVLHFLPFGALSDPSVGYLMERHSICVAPSASVFVRCAQNRRKRASQGREQMLGVGDPSFDHETFPLLQSLREARTEVNEAAKYYAPNSVVLTANQASPGEVLTAIKNADVIHFASHALLNEQSSWQPALVLAPDATERTVEKSGSARTREQAGKAPGLLYLDELSGTRMPRSRLVVLSACDSGLGRYYRGEGLVSLVRPFITSGVPTVVATLWKVDDEATALLMVEFHKLRTQVGLTTSDALIRAQLGMASGAFGQTFQHPYYWAPFLVVGSGG